MDNYLGKKNRESVKKNREDMRERERWALAPTCYNSPSFFYGTCVTVTHWQCLFQH
jgi:hypothetical protein